MRAGENDVVPLHQPFEVSFRGFRRRQVLEHLESLEGELAMVGADRDDALEQAANLRKLLEHVRRESEEAHACLERLARSPGSVGGTSERLHRMMLLAEAETTELRRRADEDVTTLRKQAESEACHIRAVAEQKAAESHAACAQQAAEFEEQRHRLMAEHAGRVRRFEEEQRTKRAECAERDEESRRRATLLLHLVAQESRRRCEQADRRCTELQAVQADLAARLRTMLAAVADAGHEIDTPLHAAPAAALSTADEGTTRPNPAPPAQADRVSAPAYA